MDPLRWLTRFLLTLLGLMVLCAVFAASARAADDVVLRERAEWLDDFATGVAYAQPGEVCIAILDAWSGGDLVHYSRLMRTSTDETTYSCEVWYREDESIPWSVIYGFPEARQVEWSPTPVCPVHDGLEPTIVFRTAAQCSANDPACDGYPGPVHMCEYRSAAAKCSALQGLPVPSSQVAGFTGVASCTYPTEIEQGTNPVTCAFSMDATSGQYRWTGAMCNGNGVGNVECDKLPMSATAYVPLGTASGGSGAAGPSTWASGPATVPSTVCSGSCRYTVNSRSAMVYPSGWSGAGTTQVSGRYELSNQGQLCHSDDAQATALPGFASAVVQGTISAPTSGGGGASAPTTGTPANEAAWGNYGSGGSSSGGSGSSSGGTSGGGTGAVGGSTSTPSGSASNCTQQPCDGWSGSCESGFQCTGDPVQCAQAQAAYSLACSMRTDRDNVAVKEAGEALAAAGSSPDGGWGAAGSTRSFSLGSFMGQTFGPDGGCVSDVSVSAAGQSFVLPFSEYCGVLTGLGLAGNAISMVIAIGIVFGRRSS